MALKAAQKQAQQLPQVSEKLQEAQTALQEKTQQHSMALNGVQDAQRVIESQENVISEKDRIIAELRDELSQAKGDSEKSRYCLSFSVCQAACAGSALTIQSPQIDEAPSQYIICECCGMVTRPLTRSYCRQQLQWMKELMGQIDTKISESHEQVRRRSRRPATSAYSAQSTSQETVEAAGLPSSPASDRYYHSEHSRPLPCTGF